MLSLTMLVAVTSLQLVNSRDSDSQPHLQPDFGPAPNVTRVQVDSTAFLHCNVLNLHEDNQVENIQTSPSSVCREKYFQVSWIRRRDWHIMSVGETVYTTDDRVTVTRKKDSADWQLQFKFAKERDEGTYECQVERGCMRSWSLAVTHPRSPWPTVRSSPGASIWRWSLLRPSFWPRTSTE